jgi:hypothetical protein
MTTVRRILGAAVVVTLLILAFGSGWVVGRMGVGSIVDPESLTQVERDFVERMRGVQLVGTFDVAGAADASPREDRYDIHSVEKVGDDLWRFNAGMKCCGLNGATIPVVVPMRWTGDTPTVMMTDTTLPGLGTFTARVLFYGDRYAGMWQHGVVGGNMSGRIERQTSISP